jgi:hypothetical protein
MRKIESEMNRAIATGTNWSKANTTVTMEGDVAEIRLHGNLIAKVGEGFIQIFDGGWQSVTTKSRLNAIFEGNGCPGEGVFQSAWKWFVRVNQGGGNYATVDFVSGMRIN